MNLPLALKYRPSAFADVIGQDHVTQSLSSALDSKQVHHAYLFSGPRGCGKTSSARILARSLNCEKGPTSKPCGSCQSCIDLVANGPGSLDVIEMDAATHGLVDDARELRDKALFAPVQSRYKIYIIDEAHQLGPAAANALLKIVEEPPPYVIFIFATTEPEKVIPTIRSRTHHYQFKLVGPEALTRHLEQVSKLEKISLEEGVINLAVRAGNGSVRDSLSSFGQLLNGAIDGKVSYASALSLLGQTSNNSLNEIVSALLEDRPDALFELVNGLIEAGSDLRRFTLDLLDRVRDLMILSASSSKEPKLLRSYGNLELQSLLTSSQKLSINVLIALAEIVSDTLVKLRSTSSPQITLETMMMKLLVEVKTDSSSNVVPQPQSSSAPISQKLEERVELNPKMAPESSTATRSPSNKNQAKIPLVDFSVLQSNWSRVLENIKNRRRLTWTLLSSQSQPLSFDGKLVKISLPSSGALDSFERSNSSGVLEEAMKEIFHGEFSIEMVIKGSQESFVNKVVEANVEDSTDQVSGEELLMRELGASVISKEDQ